MRHLIAIKRSLRAAATALAAVGFLTVPAPVQADDWMDPGGCPPKCPDVQNATLTNDADVYAVPGDNKTIKGVVRNGSQVQITGGYKPNDWTFVFAPAGIVPNESGWVRGSSLVLGWQSAPKGYSALAISWQSHRWATAQGYEHEGDAVTSAVNDCYSAAGGCEFWTVPDEKGACVAGFVPPAGGPIVEYGPDPASAESALYAHNIPILGSASVCATNGRLAAGPVWDSGVFDWAESAKPSAITLAFDEPVLFPLPKVVARVGISNNAGKPTVGCDFVSPLPAHFTVTGDAITPVDLPAPVKGVPYNVTVTCGGVPPHNETKTF